MLFAAYLALFSALSFAASTTMLRRGVMKGTVAQAMAVTVPLGAVVGWLALLATGAIWPLDASFHLVSFASLAGIVHFVAGRYCHYRAIQAIGANLVAPVQQTSVVVTLLLAVGVLGELPTPLQMFGIAIVLLSPLIIIRQAGGRAAAGGSQGFVPDLRSGYTFAGLSAIAFGLSPILISYGLREATGALSGLIAATIAYSAATLVVVSVLACSRASFAGMPANRRSLGWYALSGITVAVSQLFVYMALAIAPASVIVPLQRTSIVMRFGLAGMFNREAEVFDARMLVATVLCLLGAVAIAVDPAHIEALIRGLSAKS